VIAEVVLAEPARSVPQRWIEYQSDRVHQVALADTILADDDLAAGERDIHAIEVSGVCNSQTGLAHRIRSLTGNDAVANDSRMLTGLRAPVSTTVPRVGLLLPERTGRRPGLA
jgi:hypothetical protein